MLMELSYYVKIREKKVVFATQTHHFLSYRPPLVSSRLITVRDRQRYLRMIRRLPYL